MKFLTIKPNWFKKAKLDVKVKVETPPGLICNCGHDDSMHYDGDQCVDITCGCREFEEK